MLALTLEKLVYVINKPFSRFRRQTYEEKRAYEFFETNDLVAKTIILAFMNDLIRGFTDYPMAKEMFDTISSKYNNTTTMLVQLLLKQYNSYKMKKSCKVVDHVNKMLVMAKDLAIVENDIPDNMQISTVLNSLPPSWDMAVIVLNLQFDIRTLEKLPIQLAI
ncbi:uncharacterized protein LOC126409757 [Nymphaea colorata]|uniref:uncharacterized protein LOC126409757 n=1 Tax=Nymphaea colorata TaxID=210225 RepID=UPI00214E19ED|nr:uncharacterized protein LOC126409757 [Nymphaea colorata]